MALADASAPKTSPTTTTRTAKRDAQILRFFQTHPRLARTPAGQREIVAALTRRIQRLEHKVRSLQAAKAARTPPGWWLEQAACIRAHEGAWTSNTGNGFYGAYQFLLSTWQSVGGEGYPHQASEEEQNYRAWVLWQRSGWAPWPNTARYCGLL